MKIRPSETAPSRMVSKGRGSELSVSLDAGKDRVRWNHAKDLRTEVEMGDSDNGHGSRDEPGWPTALRLIGLRRNKPVTPSSQEEPDWQKAQG